MTSAPIPDRAFREGMEAGRRAALGILRHPATAGILARYEGSIRDRVPVELAPDQFGVTDLGLAVGNWPMRGGWLRPEGVPALYPGDPPPGLGIYEDRGDPRLTAGPWCAGWPGLPEESRRELHGFVGALRSLVAAEARELAAAGVPIDPGSPLDLSLLVQLGLLEVRGSAEEVVAGLNLVPPYALSGDGRDLRSVRDGTTADVERAATVVRRWWRSQRDDDRRAQLRDRGGRPSGSRTSGSDAALVREHLPAVLEAFPQATAALLRGQWQRNVRGSAGVRLRELMGRRTGDPPPALRTVQRALQELRQ